VYHEALRLLNVSFAAKAALLFLALLPQSVNTQTRPMLLALDTATPACTAALFAADGSLLARADEVMSRGHAERLMPMLEDLLAGRRPEAILVGCGPGSFTGLRVGIAAAHGLALGWGASLRGFPTLALMAAAAPGEEAVAVALQGGHGELFVQAFERQPILRPLANLASLAPAEAALRVATSLVVGSGSAALVEARGHGQALPQLPSAADVLRLPEELRRLNPKPIYARAPDAKAKAA
jgi:tRNA threonylcarbamoyl adenosine modification protein YeaZ